MKDLDVVKKAEELIEAKRYEEALQWIDQNIHIAGDLKPRLINAKVVALMMLDRYKEAADTYEGVSIQYASPEYLDKFYNLMEIHHRIGNPVRSEACQYKYAKVCNDEKSKRYIEELILATKIKEDNIQAGYPIVERDCEELANLYAVQGYSFECIFLLAAKKIEHEEMNRLKTAEAYFRYANDPDNVYIVVESEAEPIRGVFLSSLQELAERVYYIRKPVQYETEGLNYSKEDLIHISLQNQVQSNHLTSLTPVMLADQNTGKTLDTTIELLAGICRQEEKYKKCMLFIHKNRYDELRFDARLRTLYVNRNWHNPFNEFQMYWIGGDYKVFYTTLYNFDIQAALDALSTCKISIVIPTRNCPETLRYTLLSCLDQDYEDYEIVLSDNGDPGDEAVLELAEELNAKCVSEGRSPKIKYYHTPGLLPLPKSFEYAYLRSQGEFIFGLGSDDAVMPGSLRLLAQCLDENPDAEVIQWNRNAYFWPNVGTGEKDRLTYAVNYDKGSYETVKLPCKVLFQLIKARQMDIYALPLCYINSGMRRSYMKRVIEATGTLIGGACQDVYMAVVNLYLLKDVLLMKYPVTMSGQSGKSIGIKATFGHRTPEEQQKAAEEWRKLSVMPEAQTLSQELLPVANWDVSLFYNQLLRVRDLDIGKLPGDDEIDYRWLFEEALKRLRLDDLNFPVHVGNFMTAAKRHGEDFEKWFLPLAEKRINDQRMYFEEKAKSNTQKGQSKTYREQKHPDANGHVILDASNYGISDIYAAAKFVDEQIDIRNQ